MIKVVHIITGLKIGGAETALYRLITNFEKNNYIHSVISLTSGGGFLKKFEQSNIQVNVFDFKVNPAKQFWKLFLFIKSSKPDIVNTWMYHANIVGGVTAWFGGSRKVIWGLRTTDTNKGSKKLTGLIRRIGALLSYIIPKKIICVAEASKQSHIKIGYSKKNMTIINNGFDIKKFKFDSNGRRNLRKKLGFLSNEIVIGSIGRFNEAKDQQNLIRAAGIISKKQLNVKFLLAGQGITNDNLKLNSWIIEEGIKDKIILLGNRSDIPICLSSMDIFCLHSSREGFPNILAEAMLIGLPSVSTDVGDAKLLLKNIGILVPKENPTCLAEAIIELIELSENEKKLIAEKSRTKIYNNFSIKSTCSQYELVYNKVLNEK